MMRHGRPSTRLNGAARSQAAPFACLDSGLPPSAGSINAIRLVAAADRANLVDRQTGQHLRRFAALFMRIVMTTAADAVRG